MKFHVSVRQSASGFWKAGGFTGIYRGLSAAALGSAPGAAIFFSTYDTLKHKLADEKYSLTAPSQHMIAASCGEIVRDAHIVYCILTHFSGSVFSKSSN